MKYLFVMLITIQMSCFPPCNEDPLFTEEPRCSNSSFRIIFDDNLSEQEIDLIVKEFDPVIFEKRNEYPNEGTVEYSMIIDSAKYNIRRVALAIKRKKGVVDVEASYFQYAN